MSPNRAEMGRLAPRRQHHLSRVRNLLRRPTIEESHNVLYQSHLVESVIGWRNSCLSALEVSAGVADGISTRGQNNGVVRRVAESEDAHRGGQRGEVWTERAEGTGRIRGGAGDEPESVWGTEGAADGEADGMSPLTLNSAHRPGTRFELEL